MIGTLSRTIYAGRPVGVLASGENAYLPPAFPNANANETLDYAVDFSNELAGGADTALASAAISITPAGALTASNIAITGLACTFLLGGGVANAAYLVTVSAALASTKNVQANVALFINPVPNP